jgi:hypothetical protein
VLPFRHIATSYCLGDTSIAATNANLAAKMGIITQKLFVFWIDENEHRLGDTSIATTRANLAAKMGIIAPNPTNTNTKSSP